MSKKNISTTESVEAVPTVAQPSAPPAKLCASPHLLERMAEVKDNLESIENFRLPRAKMTPEGLEFLEGQPPIKEVEGVILHTKKTNMYYANTYTPGQTSPPDCYSLDGILPDKSVQSPVHPKCQGCPMAEFGTNQMKKGKACRNLKPLFMLLSEDAIIPRQIVVTPSSLKAANQYLMDITERGFDYKKITTKITLYKENTKDTYLKMKFSMASKLSSQRVADTLFLKSKWLPVMDSQIIDMTEFENANQAAAPMEANGEF